MPGQPGTRGQKGEVGRPGTGGLQGPKGDKGRDAGGVKYVRWGRTTCPSGADIVYKGIVGGSHYSHSGGGGEYLCLPKYPKYDTYQDGFQSHSYIYGAEYEILNGSCTITIHHVSCVTSNRVQPNWWYPRGMSVLLVGPKSTTGTQCQSVTTTVLANSFVLTRIQSLFMAVILTITVPFCSSWKDLVARYHVSHMLKAESWHAQCVLSEPRTDSETSLKLQNYSISWAWYW